MANFQRTETVGDSADRQTLADLIGTAGVQNLLTADVIGLAAVSITSTSANTSAPVNGTWWWDQTDQLFKMPVLDISGFSTSFYASVGPDAWDFPGYNINSYTVHKGSLLRWDTAAGANVYGCTPMEPITTFMTDGRALRAHAQMCHAYGFAAEHIAPEQYGPVRTEGFGHVRGEWNTYSDLYLNSENDHTMYPLVPSTQYTGYVQAVPRGYGLPTWISQVAAGVVRPHNITATSVLAPALIHLPAGRVGQLQ